MSALGKKESKLCLRVKLIKKITLLQASLEIDQINEIL